ncbi:cyclic nucleotide-binding/CBS domain-containing protein [Melioribacteraceae bacterium 4301-Me]|uniref:CBS domain-containing protein n=1 Tax=Pyranulibacter aquaticus TaxID=3163344 RepID=UPI0035997EB9
MKVKDILTENAFTVYPNTSLKEVIRIFHENNLTSLVVVNEHNEVVGMVTYSDLFRYLFPDYNEIANHGEYLFDPHSIELRNKPYLDKPIKDFMIKSPESIDSEKPAIEAAAIMKSYKIKQLPVTENGKLIGIITIKELLKIFVIEKLKNM